MFGRYEERKTIKYFDTLKQSNIKESNTNLVGHLFSTTMQVGADAGAEGRYIVTRIAGFSWSLQPVQNKQFRASVCRTRRTCSQTQLSPSLLIS